MVRNKTNDMSPKTSRRRFLSGLAAVSIGVNAGCLGTDPPELRVRNFTNTAQTLHVEIATGDGETLLNSDYDIGSNEQTTEAKVYDSAGTYVVTVTVGRGTTNSEISIDDPDNVITHVTVRDDGVNVGQILP